jgi:hypothetical protein
MKKTICDWCRVRIEQARSWSEGPYELCESCYRDYNRHARPGGWRWQQVNGRWKNVRVC